MDSQNRFINITKFLESRSKEICYLNQLLSTKKIVKTTRIFQNLPKHQRRRAMSHNRKRIPSRLRNQDILSKNFGKRPSIKRKFISKTGRMYRKRLRKKLLAVGADYQIFWDFNTRIRQFRSENNKLFGIGTDFMRIKIKLAFILPELKFFIKN